MSPLTPGDYRTGWMAETSEAEGVCGGCGLACIPDCPA
jgi:hypothetical protein